MEENEDNDAPVQYKISGEEHRERVQKVIDKVHQLNSDSDCWDVTLRDKGPFVLDGVKFIRLETFRGGGKGDVQSSAVIEIDGKFYIITHWCEYDWNEVALGIVAAEKVA